MSDEQELAWLLRTIENIEGYLDSLKTRLVSMRKKLDAGN